MTSLGQVAEGAGPPDVVPIGYQEDPYETWEDHEDPYDPWEHQEDPYETWEPQEDPEEAVEPQVTPDEPEEDDENPYDPWEHQEDPYEMWEGHEDPYDPWEQENPYDPGDVDYDDIYSSSDRASPAPSRPQPPTPTVQPAEIWALDEAISLLELSMSSDMEQEEDEREQLVTLAVGVLKRQRERRRNAGREREPDSCVVCCAERADTLLMPCRHLVLCGTCCDRMGIKERGSQGRREVPCPICRTMVEGTIKTFRG